MTRRDDRSVGEANGEAPVPSWLGAVDPADGAPAAILVAAAQLFSERSPSKVTLREIAERAGVNYGLIHHYYGTKDAILAELVRQSSATGAANMEGTTSLATALAALVDIQSTGAHIRMLASVILSDSAASRSFTASPAIRHLAGLAAEAGGERAVDPKVQAVALVSALMGWQLFRPFLVAAAELDDHDPVALNAAVYAMVQRLAAAAAPRPSTGDGSGA